MVRLPLRQLPSVTPRTAQPFFNPSYRCLSLASSSSSSSSPLHSLHGKSKATRRCSFSSGAGSSSSRPGPNSRTKPTSSPSSAPTQPATASKTTSTGSATVTTTAPATNPNARTATTPLAAPPVTPFAPSLPHATPGLVGLDAFFALDRPLLELPIRLNYRKSVAAPERLVGPPSALEQQQVVETAEVDVEVQGAMEALDMGEGCDELAEVVDLGPNGEPIGEPYLTTLASASRMEPLRTAEEEREIELREELDAAEEAEAALQELEAEDYDAWLIGDPEGTLHPVAVARYLASQSPFVPPPAPLLPVSSPSGVRASSLPSAAGPASTTGSTLSPQAQSDLSFLRPFPHATLVSTAATASSTLHSQFASQLADPLSSAAAKQHADRFLSSTSLTHRWHATRDYTRNVSEPLELARRAYKGLSLNNRRPFNEKRQRGEVRMWSEQDGWTTVDLSRGGEASPFLPAEMVDLDWVDENGAEEASLDSVRMDSVKRKRKKKITKHKYKKRRKAQKALRQRLGK